MSTGLQTSPPFLLFVEMVFCCTLLMDIEGKCLFLRLPPLRLSSRDPQQYHQHSDLEGCDRSLGWMSFLEVILGVKILYHATKA